MLRFIGAVTLAALVMLGLDALGGWAGVNLFKWIFLAEFITVITTAKVTK